MDCAKSLTPLFSLYFVLADFVIFDKKN